MPLPSPPKSVGSRPLPPNPSGGSDDGPPPPLPSRPGGASRNPPPPPVNGHGQMTTEEYLEPDDWTGGGVPVIPPKNFSSGSSDSENEEYVEPEESSPPPPVSRGAPPGRGAKPPAPIPEPEQETYDELDDLVPPPPVEEFQQETYDECEFKAPTQGQPAQLVQEELYEFDPEDNSDEEIQESLYEAVTEDDRRGGGSPSQPVPPSIPPPHRPAIPAPPSPPVSAPPSLPSRPPARVPEPAHESEPSPARAVLKKNISGEGAKLLGAISPAEIGAKIGALRKVSTSSEPPKEEPKPQESDSAGSGNSFADRMAKFKSAEKDSDSDSSFEESQEAPFISPTQISHAQQALRKVTPPSKPLPFKPQQHSAYRPVQSIPPKSPQPRQAEQRSQTSRSFPSPTPQKRTDTRPNTKPIDTSNLTIAQRIALMKGQSISEVQSLEHELKPVARTCASNTSAQVAPPIKTKPNLPAKPSSRPEPGQRNTPTNMTVQPKVPPIPVKPKQGGSQIPPATPSKPNKGLTPPTGRKHAGYDLVPIRKENEVVTQHGSGYQHSVNAMRSPPAMETTPAPPPVAKATPQTQAPQNEQDDIYDDGLSFMADPLQNEEWYHGMVSRNESKAKLDTIQQDGAFLVRKSEKGGDHQPYTLVVLFKGHVYNLKVRVRSDNQVALGEAKPDEMAFKDVPALISHHKHNDVILVNVAEKKQYKTLLKRFPLNIMK